VERAQHRQRQPRTRGRERLPPLHHESPITHDPILGATGGRPDSGAGPNLTPGDKVFPIGGVHSPEFPDFETRALYRNAVALAIKEVTDAGLDIVTDGCQHYEMESDYEQGEIFHYYLDRLEGFVPYGDRISAGEFDNLPIYKPTCVGPIGWRRPIFKPMVEAVVEQTDKPNKIQAAVGPATMAARIRPGRGRGLGRGPVRRAGSSSSTGGAWAAGGADVGGFPARHDG